MRSLCPLFLDTSQAATISWPADLHGCYAAVMNEAEMGESEEECATCCSSKLLNKTERGFQGLQHR